jgi:hypothetical protein
LPIPAPEAASAIDHAAPVPSPDTSGPGIPDINPITGLSTDYLNHFTEAIMLLEILPVMPDCLPDFLAWEPKDYREHFAAGHFRNRDRVISAYEAADPELSRSLDMLADLMNTTLLATREAIASNPGTIKSNALAARAAAVLKPIVTRVAALINGTAPGLSSRATVPQAEIDAMFRR